MMLPKFVSANHDTLTIQLQSHSTKLPHLFSLHHLKHLHYFHHWFSQSLTKFCLATTQNNPYHPLHSKPHTALPWTQHAYGGAKGQLQYSCAKDNACLDTATVLLWVWSFYITFNNLKYSVLKTYILFAYVYSFYPAEPLIIEHVNSSMVTTSKTSLKPKLLSIQERLDITNMVDVTWNFPHRRSFQNFALPHQLKTGRHYSACKWATENSIYGIVPATASSSSTSCASKESYLVLKRVVK